MTDFFFDASGIFSRIDNSTCALRALESAAFVVRHKMVREFAHPTKIARIVEKEKIVNLLESSDFCHSFQKKGVYPPPRGIKKEVGHHFY